MTASAVCLATDPVFLGEGPVTAPVVDNGGGNGLVTTMGIPVLVTDVTTVGTPTNPDLGLTGMADTTPFPGRSQPGFEGATVIITGCVNAAGNAEATDVFSDVSENVVLGVVTGLDVDGNLLINDTPVSVLTDARMPGPVDANGLPTWNRLGIPVQTATIPVGAPAAAEGYFGDLDQVLHVWDANVDGGVPVIADQPQVGIAEYRCRDATDIRVIGGTYVPTPAPADCTVQSVRVVDAGNEAIVFGTAVPLATAPASQFCEYVFNADIGGTCGDVTVEFVLGGAVVATATTLPGDVVPPPQPPVATADAVSTDEDVVLTVAAPGVLANDLNGDGSPVDVLTATAQLQTPTGNGDVVLNADGSFTYTPDEDFFGTDFFAYRVVVDGAPSTNFVNVTITVNPVNDAPVAVDDAAAATAGDTIVIPVLANDIDVEDDPLSIVAVGPLSDPALGTATTDGAVITFTAAAGVTTPSVATFTYTVSDGGLVTDEGLVTVTIDPQAVGDTVVVARTLYRAVGSEWRILGSTTAPGAVLTATLDRTGQVIGSATANVLGTWLIRVPGSPVVPIAGDTITVTSSAGGVDAGAGILIQ